MSLKINNIEFPERHENPSVGNKVALQSFFYNAGVLVDPIDVSSVSIFKYDTYASSALFIPSSLLLSAQPLMQFEGSAYPESVTGYDGDWGAPAGAVPADFAYASGIFKLGPGNFVVPLRLDKPLSGAWETEPLAASAGINTAATYVDIWTVKLMAGSDYQCIINIWNLFDNAFFNLTQPLIIKTKVSLSNKHLTLGSKIDLVAPIEVTVQNRDIDKSIINVLKSTLITAPAFKITKVNDNTTLDGPFTVSGWTDTASDTQVTSDGTLLFRWDTSQIPTSNTFGEAKGTYAVQMLYYANGQKIISPRFYVSVN